MMLNISSIHRTVSLITETEPKDKVDEILQEYMDIVTTVGLQNISKRCASSSRSIVNNGNYKILKELGKCVVKSLVKNLDDYPMIVMSLLQDITGSNPVPKESMYLVNDMVNIWKEFMSTRESEGD